MSKAQRYILIAFVVILQLALVAYVILNLKQGQPSNRASPHAEELPAVPDKTLSQLVLYKTMLLTATEIDSSSWKVGAGFFYRFLSKRREHNLHIFTANPTADDRFLAFLTRFPLTILALKGTHITGAGLAKVAEMPTLEELDIEGIQVTPNDLRWLTSAKRLIKLAAGNCGLNDEGLSVLSKKNNFVALNLENNRKISDKGIAFLRDELALKEFSLKRVPITDRCAGSLAHMRSIEVLILVGTHISDECLPYLARLNRLFSLDLGDTMITDKGLRAFNPPVLKHLFIQNCRKVTAGGVREFISRHPGCEVVIKQESSDKDWQFTGATRELQP